MIEPLWLPIEEVIKNNQEAVADTGERFHVRDFGLLESAINKPKNHYDYNDERDVVTLSCLLLFGIANNHPFEQGNKRTGFFSAIQFLEINGCVLGITDDEYWAKLMVNVMNNVLPQDVFVAYFRRCIFLEPV